MFKSMIHFEFVFCQECSIRSMSRFLCFCMWLSNCYSIIYQEDYLYSEVLPWPFCLKSVHCIYGNLFRALHSVPLIYLFILLPVTHSLDPCKFIISLKVRECQYSNLVLLQYFIGFSGSSASLHRLQGQFVNIYKITCWWFDWIIDQVRKNKCSLKRHL